MAQVRLEATGEFEVFTWSRQPGTLPGAVQVDVESSRSLFVSIESGHFSAVIVALRQKDPLVQRICADLGVPCIDVSPTDDLRRTVEKELASADTPLLTMCGFFPGLSGVMAADAASELDEIHEIRVGLLQSPNARVGATGVNDMLGMITRSVQTPSGPRPGFTVRRTMRFGSHKAAVRRIHYDEAGVLAEKFATDNIGYYTAWSSTSLTLLVAAMNHFGLLGRLAQSRLHIAPRHNPRKPEIACLRVESIGTHKGKHATRSITAEACGDYRATAGMVLAMTCLLLEDRHRFNGVAIPMDIVTLDELYPLLESAAVAFT